MMPYAPQYLPFYLSAPPDVTTLPATGITPTKATLNGSVNANGLPTDYWFEWWKGAKPLVRAAQDLGAAFIYGPETATDPLSNLGNLPGLPDGTFPNGGKLTVPGLMDGAAAAELDGVENYINMGWETRTNLATNPLAATAKTGWETWVSAAPERVTDIYKYAPASIRQVADGTRPYEGVFVPYNDLVEGKEQSWGIWVRASKAGTYHIQFRNGPTDWAVGAVDEDGNPSPFAFAAGQWKFVKVEGYKPPKIGADKRLVAFAQISEGNIPAEETIHWQGLIVRDGPTLGPYFPTPAQLEPFDPSKPESGLAGWSGTAHESASDIGPFARGTARTFVGMAERASSESNDVIFGSTAATGALLRLAAGTNDVLLFPAASASAAWPGAWPGNAQKVRYAVSFDAATKTARLYIDGVDKGAGGSPIADTWASSGASMILGAWGASADTDPFGGLQAVPMIFLGDLSAEQIAELSEATTLLPNYAPAGKDGDAGEGSEAVAVSEEVTGLEHKTRYRFRLYGTNEDGEAFGDDLTFQAGHSVIAVTREYPPDKLAVRIADPSSGQTIARWAEDEPLTENVITGIRKSGEMPGGHKEMSGSLARDPRRDYPDLPPYADIYLEEPGRESVWRGRLDKAPESDGERMVIEPAAVGHQAALLDRKGIIGPGFINRDLGRFTDPSTARKLALRKVPTVPYGPSVIPDKDLEDPTPSLELGWTDDWTSPYPNAEAWLDGTVDIARVKGSFEGYGTVVASFANFDLYTGVADDDAAVSYEQSADLMSAASGTFDYTPATARRFFWFQLRHTAAGGGPGQQHGVQLKDILALGNHDLTLQGEPGEEGFTAKQMLEYAVPLYSYLEVSDESIEDDGYIIPQAWYSDPGMLADVVKDLTKYGLLDWFVLNGKLFEVRFPGTYGRKWQASAGPSELKEAGVDASRLWRSILCRYTDVDGSIRTVGPPGSGANVEASGLEITDPDHPAVKAGKAREDLLDLKGICTAARAQEAGERWLEDANELSRSGSAVLSGYVMDDKSVFRPVAQVMPGDQVRFPDAASADYRKIVAVDYEHDSRSCQVSLDAPSDAIPALLERYQADLISLGL